MAAIKGIGSAAPPGPVREGTRMTATAVFGGGVAGPLLSTVKASGMGKGSVFLLLIIIAASLVVLAAVFYMLGRWRRDRLVGKLLATQRALEGGRRELFSERKAAEIISVAPDLGRPRTVSSEGRIAYTEAGEMLTFGARMDHSDDGVVAAVVAPAPMPAAGAPDAPEAWMTSYSLEMCIALHATGVALLAVGRDGKTERGDKLDPRLLLLLEELLDEARWSPGDVVTGIFLDRTVCVRRGKLMHLVTVVDGDPDERLDRELRWALADLQENISGGPREGAEGGWRLVDLQTLANRLSRVLALTKGADPARGGARSKDGSVKTSSNVALRHGLVEYTVGVVNEGPGSIFDVQLLPILGPEGAFDVVTAQGIDIDAKGRFIVPELAEGQKASVTFVFRPAKPASVRFDCNLIYLRGAADVEEVRMPGRWVEVEGVEPSPGEAVEPERAMEIATQPAAFMDRCAYFLPMGSDPDKLSDACVDSLREHLGPVARLEDTVTGRSEAWFHGEMPGGVTVAACVSVLPQDGVLDLYATSTASGVVPGTMLMLRSAAERGAGQRLIDAFDPELRCAAARAGFLLEGSWGDQPGT